MLSVRHVNCKLPFQAFNTFSRSNHFSTHQRFNPSLHNRVTLLNPSRIYTRQQQLQQSSIASCIVARPLCRTTVNSQSRRTYMDVHTRPSHSRMFDRPGNPYTPPGQQPPPPTPTPPRPHGEEWRLMLPRLAIAYGLVYCWHEYVYDITLCEGPSMMPTIQPSGEIILMDKWSMRLYGIEGGCIGEERAKQAQRRQEEYVQKNPKKADVWYQPYVSVTDIADDPLTLRQKIRHVLSPISVGDVVVVKHPLRKSSVCKRVLGLPGDQVLDRGIVVVPDGHLWLEGDNPTNSADSRQYGPVPAALIMGRVVARIWPLRGQAWMRRGGRPNVPPEPITVSRSHLSTGSTVLPAGYSGERILLPKKKSSQTEEEEEDEE